MAFSDKYLLEEVTQNASKEITALRQARERIQGRFEQGDPATENDLRALFDAQYGMQLSTWIEKAVASGHTLREALAEVQQKAGRTILRGPRPTTAVGHAMIAHQRDAYANFTQWADELLED